MTKLKAALVAGFVGGESMSSALHAQTPPTPEAQALAQKLMSEINANIACSTNVITLQQQLAAAQAKIKALEEKAVPNKDAPK